MCLPCQSNGTNDQFGITGMFSNVCNVIVIGGVVAVVAALAASYFETGAVGSFALTGAAAIGGAAAIIGTCALVAFFAMFVSAFSHR